MTKRKARAPDEIVVFWIVRDSECSECGAELGKGRFLVKEGDGVLCLSCAGLDHLVFLERGDAALTRRAGKHSSLRAVVVRFSRARGRYERQGILVDRNALERAETECLGDEDARARRREREARRRERLDVSYVREFAKRIRARYPGMPADMDTIIAEHACEKQSRRVGRTADAKDFVPKAIDLAVTAHVRHALTDYDRLLAGGWERSEARARVGEEIRRLLAHWREPGAATAD